MRFIGSAVAAIAVLAFLMGFSGSSSSVEAATITIRGVATGAEENPAISGGGSAYVTVRFDDVANTLSVQATISGLSSDLVTAAHIHRGARGVNGPIVHNLSTTGFTQLQTTINLSAADVADLRAGNFYFNAHSKDNPGGFARMQIILPAAPAAPAPAPSAPAPSISPPATGDAGLAETGSFGLVALAALVLSGGGVLAVARKRA